MVHVAHLLISAVGETTYYSKPYFVELFLSSELKPILFASDPALQSLQSALCVLQEEVAETFVQFCSYGVPRAQEEKLVFHSLGNVGRKLG